jgi:hypothetical protein
MEIEWSDVKFLFFLTITLQVFDGQIFDYKQLALNTKIGDPTRLADVVKSIKASS